MRVFLEGRRDGDAPHVEGARKALEVRKRVGGERDVDGIETRRAKRGVVHHRREGVAHGLAENAEDGGARGEPPHIGTRRASG